MAKQPKRAPTTSRPKSVATHRVTGSAALIAALQAATFLNPQIKVILLCAAPAVIELFLVCYGYAVRRFLEYLDHKEVFGAKKRAENEQAEKLRLAEQKLNEALSDPNLADEEKTKLKKGFAEGKRVLAEKAMHNAFEIYTPSEESANSAQQAQGDR